MDKFQPNDESRALQEVNMNDMHNRSQHGHFQTYFRKNQRNRGPQNYAGAGSIGAHLDDFGDGEMKDEDFCDEKPQNINGGGSHAHTQSCQIPQTSYVPQSLNFQFKNDKLSRKASKGKLIGPQGYQSQVQSTKPQQPSMQRRSTVTSMTRQ